MTWRTHVAIGTNAIWLAGLTGHVDQSIIVLLPTAIIASLLPDIDASSAKIHYAAGGALGIFKGSFYGKYFHHRGLMHSFLVATIFFVALMLAFGQTYPLLAPIFALSYISHPIIDGFNTGVGYLYPFVHKRYALLPKFLRFQVGSPMDSLLMFAGLAGLLIFFAAFAHQLIPNGSLVPSPY
jgi:membrane-bound metal-dependent hydrolase YbcI (DUF457 family)